MIPYLVTQKGAPDPPSEGYARALREVDDGIRRGLLCPALQVFFDFRTSTEPAPASFPNRPEDGDPKPGYANQR
jgi:hypothetical protein